MILADPMAEQGLSVWQRLKQVWAAPRARRERTIELHKARVLLLALGLQAMALVLLATLLWAHQRSAADASAEVAIGFLDQRLDELDATLRQVEGQLPASSPDGWQCEPGLTDVLLRTSLDSTLVQRLWLVAADGSRACGPQGSGSVGELPPIQGSWLALVSLRSIATEMVLARRLPDGRVLAARLEERALALPAEGVLDSASGQSQDITLMSSDRRTLRIWGGARAPGDSVSSLQVQRRSAQHDLTVSVEQGRQALVGQLLRLWPLAAAAAALITLLVGALAWRQAMARSRRVLRIERALRKRQFEPFVQPIVDIASGRCVGGEVLMRWAHPERGILAPGEFIDEAERSGLIVPMSSLVMGRAAHRLSPLAQAHPHLYFSFNITAGQLRRPAFAAELADIFSPDTLPRAQVLLELTEREALDPLTQRTVRALHAAGWRIAIDDFGTGHSSLAALERMPIDRLKIDRAFVSAVGEQTARRPVLDAIIGLARELDVRLVAEGVETQAQWDYLAQRGVDAAQGYLVAKPMSLDAFGRWFEGRLPPVGPVAGMAEGPPAQPGGAPADSLLHDEKLASLWRSMRSAGGLDIRDRLFHLRRYRQCFVGREAVDWLVQHADVPRREAVRLGRRLVALGCLRHVLDEHDFEDGEFYYTAVSDSAQDTPLPLAPDLREALLGPQGPAQADHGRGLLRHRRCLRGSELVDWLCQRYELPRATALLWGAQLMKQGRLRHVFDDRPLTDDRALYRLS